MRIDSHQHFWKYHPVKDAWITDDMKVIQRDFLPEDIMPVLAENRIDGCVAVQADQSEAETDFLLQCAAENDSIKGVVGWIDLRADNLEERLNYYAANKKLKGFRHIVQAEPDGFLLQSDFINGVKQLHKLGYTYDVLVFSRQLKDVIPFVAQVSHQKLVIDHGAKPDIKDKEIKNWTAQLKEVAQHEKVYCKVSGLITEAGWNSWKPEDIYPYLDVIFNAFGTQRVMYGSDWPVMLLAGEYRQWVDLLNDYLRNFDEADKSRFWGQNAIEFYNL